MVLPIDPYSRRKTVWGGKRGLSLLFLLSFGLSSTAGAANGPTGQLPSGLSRHAQQPPIAKPGRPSNRVKDYKLDDELSDRAGKSGIQITRVIVELVPGAKLPADFAKYTHGKLDILNGYVLDLPNGLLKKLAAQPSTFRAHYDRPAGAHNYRTAVTVGAAAVHDLLGYTGAGIGVAVIDSGITNWHDDLRPSSTSTVYPYANQRVTKFVDFVGGHTTPYDDNGHGTHVSGIIAGGGDDSKGSSPKTGIAPGASLISLKVLDANGQGTISNIIAALDWVSKNATTYNIRVVNMSIGSSIHESYWTDPLTLAAKRVVDQGIVIVAAAGNLGKNALGQPQWGSITAPGNAPWVLTVGASSTMGTLTRNDDTMAGFSSRGPTFFDFAAKPDLVAPGTGTVSLAAPGSTFYLTKSLFLVSGTGNPGYKPYLALSGTSMAAPVVSGTVALMLQANPKLTPNLVKAVLQYTAQAYPWYKSLEQGAGFLNSLGAVRLAAFFKTARPGDKVPVQKVWSRKVIWGNHNLAGGYITPSGNAWATNVVWGSSNTISGDNIVWGSMCPDVSCDNIVWGSTDSMDNIVWGSSFDDNIVWGSSCADAGCDNVVWGSGADDNIVWGSDCGGADCDNVVWGSADAADNIVWGSADPSDNIVWGSTGTDTTVWATSSSADVTWGESSDDEAVFSDDTTEPLPDVNLEFGDGIVATVPTTTTNLTPPATPVIDPVTGLPVGGI